MAQRILLSHHATCPENTLSGGMRSKRWVPQMPLILPNMMPYLQAAGGGVCCDIVENSVTSGDKAFMRGQSREGCFFFMTMRSIV